MVLWLFDWWLPLNLSEQLFYCKLCLIVGGGGPYFLHELCIKGLKENCQYKAKQKAFFSNIVNIEAQGT